MVGIRKLTTSAHHPLIANGTGRANRTMARIVSIAVNERQGACGKQLPHIEFVHNDSASSTPYLGADDVHSSLLAHFSLAVIERRGA